MLDPVTTKQSKKSEGGERRKRIALLLEVAAAPAVEGAFDQDFLP